MSKYSVEEVHELVEDLMSCCRCIGYATSGNERASHISAAKAAKEKLISAFTRPPAQAAQVDMSPQQRLDAAREMLAGMDFVVRRKEDDPLRKTPTAEQAAQGEAVPANPRWKTFDEWAKQCAGAPSDGPDAQRTLEAYREVWTEARR